MNGVLCVKANFHIILTSILRLKRQAGGENPCLKGYFNSKSESPLASE